MACENRQIGTEADFQAYLSRFDIAEIAAEATASTGNAPAESLEVLKTYFNEALLGFDLARRRMPRSAEKVLEAGAGLRIVSGYIASRGFDVTALEPIGGGFEQFRRLGEAVWRRMRDPKPKRLDIGAEALDIVKHGAFDFIFSVHVLEHVADVAVAIKAMANVLSADGEMAHLCPNYALPFEPHFSMPLIPLAPRLTGKLFSRRIQADETLWRSLNFVTARRLQAAADSAGLRIAFEKGVTARFLRRLDEDAVFRARYARSPILALHRLLKTTGALALIENMPATLMSPMEAGFAKAARKSAVPELIGDR